MLIVPLSGNLNLKNLPFVTLALIVLNTVIFFYCDSLDRPIHEEAVNYYQDSGLLELELEAYADYREETDFSDENPCSAGFRTNGCVQAMMADDGFQEAIDKERAILPGDEVYPEWRRKRDNFDGLLGSLTSMRWGMVPEKSRPLTFITSMFLHGGVMHLLGNMIFLWLVGCILEMAMGRSGYSVVYILTGILSALAFAFVYSGSDTPLVGASGAISGLMGAFSFLFWKKKIRVFYSLGFYFNTVMVYAWVLLPVWVAGEVVQLVWGGVSNVAYVAHIGGLLSGGAVALVFSRVLKLEVAEAIFDEEPEVDENALLLEEAMACMTRLDVDGARVALGKVLERDPANQRALSQLFTLAASTPDSHGFHETTARILKVYLERSDTPEVFRVYDDYRARASAFKLPAEICLGLGNTLGSHGRASEGRKLLFALAKQRPDLPGLAEALTRHANACKRDGDDAMWKKTLEVLLQRMPDSSEAAMVRKTWPDLTGSQML